MSFRNRLINKFRTLPEKPSMARNQANAQPIRRIRIRRTRWNIQLADRHGHRQGQDGIHHVHAVLVLRPLHAGDDPRPILRRKEIRGDACGRHGHAVAAMDGRKQQSSRRHGRCGETPQRQGASRKGYEAGENVRHRRGGHDHERRYARHAVERRFDSTGRFSQPVRDGSVQHGDIHVGRGDIFSGLRSAPDLQRVPSARRLFSSPCVTRLAIRRHTVASVRRMAGLRP